MQSQSESRAFREKTVPTNNASQLHKVPFGTSKVANNAKPTQHASQTSLGKMVKSLFTTS